MLGHVLAFGQDISLLGHVKKHHMLGHVLAFGLGIFHAKRVVKKGSVC
jgi:hypothetical protein